MEELKPLCVAGRKVKWCSCCEKTVQWLPRKLNIELPFVPAISLLYPKELKKRNRNLYSSVHNRIIHNSRKVETNPVYINRWRHNMSLSKEHETTEHYSTTKRNVFLIHVAIWMSLESILLSDIS